MKFSKYSMGIAISLILVILLSQSKIFNFLLNTVLGKIIFITLLIFIAFIHKILGVVVILFVIIFFNNSNLAYMEGFTSNNKIQNPAVKDILSTKDKVNQNDKKMSNSVNNSTEPVKPTKLLPVAKEGFDIIGTENNIKRGKQSNSIPVNDAMRASSDVSPHAGYSFSTFSSMV